MSTTQQQKGQVGDADEIRAVRTAISADPKLVHLGDAFELMLGTGVRFGELKSLRWGDVDMASQGIYLGHNRRRVPLDQNTRTLLETRKLREQPSEFVFEGKQLRRIPCQLAKVKAWLGTKRGFCLHSLRRVYARKLVAAALDLRTVCAILGLSVHHFDLSFYGVYQKTNPANTTTDAD